MDENHELEALASSDLHNMFGSLECAKNSQVSAILRILVADEAEVYFVPLLICVGKRFSHAPRTLPIRTMSETCGFVYRLFRWDIRVLLAIQC